MKCSFRLLSIVHCLLIVYQQWTRCAKYLPTVRCAWDRRQHEWGVIERKRTLVLLVWLILSSRVNWCFTNCQAALLDVRDCGALPSPALLRGGLERPGSEAGEAASGSASGGPLSYHYHLRSSATPARWRGRWMNCAQLPEQSMSTVSLVWWFLQRLGLTIMYSFV